VGVGGAGEPRVGVNVNFTDTRGLPLGVGMALPALVGRIVIVSGPAPLALALTDLISAPWAATASALRNPTWPAASPPGPGRLKVSWRVPLFLFAFLPATENC